MSIIGTIIESMKTALATAAPARSVTRALKDFSDRNKTELTAGIYTLISKGQVNTSRYDEHLKVLLVGQIQLTEDSTPDQIEEAELLMIDEIRRFVDGCQGVQVMMKSWQQSQQIEAPYGWVSAEIQVGPLDLSPSVDLATLGSFITFHADYDLAPKDGTIDATDIVTLPQ